MAATLAEPPMNFLRDALVSLETSRVADGPEAVRLFATQRQDVPE